MQDPSCAIVWLRRDLRISDHSALFHAANAHARIIPLYVLSDWNKSHLWTGPKRQHFLCDCLSALSRSLETVGGRLILRIGDPVREIERLAREVGAAAIYFNRDPDPHGKQTEERLGKVLDEEGIQWRSFDDVTLHDPDEVLTKTGDPYRVYTPYSNNWLSLEKPTPLGKPRALNTPNDIRSGDLPNVSHWGLTAPGQGILEAGEHAALARLNSALADRLPYYKDRRDCPSVPGTSRISQDLRFGLVSVRTVFHEVNEARKATRSDRVRESLHTYVKELAWREFYMAILHHYPNVLEEEFNPDWRGLPWDAPGATFQAWKDGLTGFPIVDAGMRELRDTGFMHNRVRMIVAMFLTKDLHLDWRLGESYFMQQLIDGEIASNNGGWQWSAGTGADAAPYFRIQNPWSQSGRHDPEGTYIKHWVPELQDTEAWKFHMPPRDGRPIANDYPLPCLDHDRERKETLARFKKHKSHLGK